MLNEQEVDISKSRRVVVTGKRDEVETIEESPDRNEKRHMKTL